MIASLYAITGGVLFAAALFALFVQRHLLRKIIAANVAASGAFLFLIANAAEAPDGMADPVPQALVLTGIVISVSVTALAVALLRRLLEFGGSECLPEDEER